MTNEERAAYIAALIEERRGVTAKRQIAENDASVASDDAQRGAAKVRLQRAESRLEAIGAELTRVGHTASAPAKRAETRPAAAREERVAPARREG